MQAHSQLFTEGGVGGSPISMVHHLREQSDQAGGGGCPLSHTRELLQFLHMVYTVPEEKSCFFFLAGGGLRACTWLWRLEWKLEI